MAYKLIEAAQNRWREVNAPHVGHVRAGAFSKRVAPVQREQATAA
jgi:hypothetical protein